MMRDDIPPHLPPLFEDILKDSRQTGFNMPSDTQTGSLLRVLASSKPHGHFLELGTGTGLGTAWILDGMDADSSLISVENNPAYQQIARAHLANDKRLTLVVQDGLEFIQNCESGEFDFIYADTWPGKYVGFEHSLRILKKGGILLLDDMLPQPNWPDDHPPKVEKLLGIIDALSTVHFATVRLCWYTGHIIITKR